MAHFLPPSLLPLTPGSSYTRPVAMRCRDDMYDGRDTQQWSEHGVWGQTACVESQRPRLLAVDLNFSVAQFTYSKRCV